MKKVLFMLAVALGLSFSGCESAQQLLRQVPSPSGGGSAPLPLSEADVARGLKEALNVGIDSAVARLGIRGAYYKNPLLFIPWPTEAQKARGTVEKILGKQAVENFIRDMNYAAEDATKEARAIFKDAILSLSIQDAWGILKGADTAATHYLRGQTFARLQAAYEPKIRSAMEKIGAQQAWGSISREYNTYVANPLFRADPVPTDITRYATQRALNGLFVKVAEKEIGIRKNVNQRVTSLLQRVFAELDKRK